MLMSRDEAREWLCEDEGDWYEPIAKPCDCCADGQCDACHGAGCADCYGTGACANCMPERDYREAQRNWREDHAQEVAHG